MCPTPAESAAADALQYETVKAAVLDENGQPYNRFSRRDTLSGNYLSSRFAQRHHDWDHATDFVSGVLKHSPDDLTLLKRGMVLSMGAGKADLAVEQASAVLKEEPYNALALLFMAMSEFKDQNYLRRLSTFIQCQSAAYQLLSCRFFIAGRRLRLALATLTDCKIVRCISITLL